MEHNYSNSDNEGEIIYEANESFADTETDTDATGEQGGQEGEQEGEQEENVSISNSGSISEYDDDDDENDDDDDENHLQKFDNELKKKIYCKLSS